MINTFSLILVIATIVTGFLWCLNKLTFSYKDDRYRTKKYTICDGFLNKNFIKKVYIRPEWFDIGASIFPVLIIVLIVRSFIYEPFQIPSGSMMPTLLIGDFILVNKFCYGIKDPLYQKTLLKIGHPKRGDIVVFKYPENQRLYYIKRTIGLPGDKIIYDPTSKKITIYPFYRSVDVYHNTVFPVTYSNIKDSDFVQTFTTFKGKEQVSSSFFKLSKDQFKGNSIRLLERIENLGNITYRILTIPITMDKPEMYYHQPGQLLSTWVVPPGKYFVMGDNRDNSSDSRYWGFVSEENLIGKATAIWMSFEKQEGKWPSGIRLNRAGLIH